MTPTPDQNKPKSAFSTGAWQDQQKQQQPQVQPAQQPPAAATPPASAPQPQAGATQKPQEAAPAPAGRSYYGEQPQPAPSTYQPPQAPAQPQAMPQAMQSYYGMPSQQPSQPAKTYAPADFGFAGPQDAYMGDSGGPLDSPYMQNPQPTSGAISNLEGPMDMPEEKPQPGQSHGQNKSRRYYGEQGVG